MSNHNDDFDDIAQARQDALGLLEGGSSRRSRHARRVDPGYNPDYRTPSEVLGEDPINPKTGQPVFDQDEIEATAEFMQEIKTGDSLAAKSALRAQKWNQLSDVAGFKRINPPSILQGVIGGQQALLPGQNAQVANWSGDDAECLPITVTLGPVNSPAPVKFAVSQHYRPYAILRWGTRGMSLSAEIDMGQGTQLTIGAASATLQVALEPEVFPLVPTTIPQPLSGMLSCYPCVRTSPLTRTKYFEFGFDYAGNTTFDIPNFAKNFVVYRRDATVAVSVVVDDSGAYTSYFFTRAANATISETFMDPLPLPGDAARMTVIGNVSMRVIFELAL